MSARPLLLLLLITASATHAQQTRPNQCNAVFSAPITNLRTQVSESSMQRFINSQLCSEKYNSASSESKAKLDVAYKVFSLGAQTGAQSVSEYQEKFCSSNTDNSAQAAFDYLQIQTVSDSALAAWSRCVELTNRGWDFEFQTPSPMTLNFRVSRTQQGSVSLTGIDIHTESPQQVACKADKVGAIGQAGITNIQIDQNGWSMSCQRTSVSKTLNGQTYSYYPETTVTVRAEGSIFAYNQPAVFVPLAPDDEVRQLRAALKKATDDSNSLRTVADSVVKRLGDFEKRATALEKNVSHLTTLVGTK
jgi:hypothetical protein